MKKSIFSIGVRENNGTPEVMFLIDLLSDYAISEQGLSAQIRIFDNFIKINNENTLPQDYVDRILDLRIKLKHEAEVQSRYQELLQTEIADELEKPKGIPMSTRIQNLLGII
jgi:hypothetical protein